MIVYQKIAAHAKKDDSLRIVFFCGFVNFRTKNSFFDCQPSV
jgi:hypothetical protein